jgi:hypothetical protein
MQQRLSRRLHRIAVAGFAGLSIAVASCPTLAWAQVEASPNVACSPMTDAAKDALDKSATGVFEQPADFIQGSQRYIVDLLSAWATQPNARSIYCIRYEVQNDTAAASGGSPGSASAAANALVIERLWWDDADLYLPRLEPGQANRRSVNQFVTLSKSPTIGPSQLAAFKNNYFKGVAYRVSSANAPPSTFALRHVIGDPGRLPYPAMLAQFPAPVRSLNSMSAANIDFPAVGTTFSGNRSFFRVRSAAAYNGKSMAYSVSLAGTGIKGVRAPFINALREAKSGPEIADRLAGQLKETTPVAVEGPAITVQALVAEEGDDRPRVPYLVEQPIVIDGPGGMIACILSTAYSPIQLPREIARRYCFDQK